MKQITFIQEWCAEKGFNFHNVDVSGKKLPCALDKNWDKDDMSIYIKGFFKGSKKISISYGGLKNQMLLKIPIDKWDIDAIKKHCIPNIFICAKCSKKNLNLKTQDNHKTYVCPNCHEDKQKLNKREKY